MTLIRDKYSIVCYRDQDRRGVAAFTGENQASKGESAKSIFEKQKDSTTSKNQLGEAIPEVKPVERKALVLVSAKMKLSSLKQEFHRDHLCSQRK
jgi:hypothetical protein